MNRIHYCIALLLVMLLMAGCSDAEADPETQQAAAPVASSTPSENVPPSQIHLSFTSHDEGTFKVKATNEFEKAIVLKDIELEAYDANGMPLEVTEIECSSGKLQSGEESGLYVYEISPAGAETRIVIDDYTYKMDGKLYEGHIYYEGY